MDLNNQVRSLRENPASAEISSTSVTPADLILRPMENALLYSGSVSNNNLVTIHPLPPSIIFLQPANMIYPIPGYTMAPVKFYETKSVSGCKMSTKTPITSPGFQIEPIPIKMVPNVQNSFSFNSLGEAKTFNLPADKSVVGCKIVKVSSATIVKAVDQKKTPSSNMHLNISSLNAVPSLGSAEGVSSSGYTGQWKKLVQKKGRIRKASQSKSNVGKPVFSRIPVDSKTLEWVTREQQYTIVANMYLNTCTLQPNKNSQIWPNPNMSHGQNQSLSYQIRNQNLDQQNYNQSLNFQSCAQSLSFQNSSPNLNYCFNNQSLNYQKSNQSLNYQKSNQSLNYQKSNQSLNYQKSNQSLNYQKSNQSLNYQKSNQSQDTFISFPKQSTHKPGNQPNQKLKEWNKPIIIQKKTAHRTPSRSFSSQKTYRSNKTTLNNQSNKASILIKFGQNDLVLQNPMTKYRENTFTQSSKITLPEQLTQKPQIYQPCKNLLMSQTNQNQLICKIYETDKVKQEQFVHSINNQRTIGPCKIENGIPGLDLDTDLELLPDLAKICSGLCDPELVYPSSPVQVCSRKDKKSEGEPELPFCIASLDKPILDVLGVPSVLNREYDQYMGTSDSSFTATSSSSSTSSSSCSSIYRLEEIDQYIVVSPSIVLKGFYYYFTVHPAAQFVFDF
ncbi:uncharacterized protein LOC111700534 isoform X5 [Eurytemora carolleeae]|uniref:uncharacterized protein LOC111700534 isoform X5 n=1 Tax=Eurytemora carolleeae TaxID=1294199 RepID=UPI000C791FA7|nr:uncharacterized protein LOC111700534 isoform X5 [Eurytemora carolleeae]|eukprot:XP_023327239.1 uncharacterized protein LOC111700534 isoform X5 [Eurytemora affinis]